MAALARWSATGANMKIGAKLTAVFGALSHTYEGTGSGLPLTKALVELHGATLDLENETGMGTTATVHLPPGRLVARSASAAWPSPRYGWPAGRLATPPFGAATHINNSLTLC